MCFVSNMPHGTFPLHRVSPFSAGEKEFPRERERQREGEEEEYEGLNILGMSSNS